MKDNYIYTTSQLAKQYDLTPKGLAFYEKHGLVSPSREQNNKYRSFNLEDCYCLHFSKFYKNVGLSINETVELEKNGNMDTIMGTINSSCETKMKQIDEEIMIITNMGIIIRLQISDISIFGRITSGVKLINLDENIKVASIAKVRKPINSDDENSEDLEEENI